MLRHVVSIAIAVLLMVVIVRQCRKPTWWPGRLFLKIMNTSHVPVTTWGLSHVQVANDATMLDVGCGGGKTIETLTTMAPSGTVFGIDYSAASVAASRRHNVSRIAQGRVDIRQGSVSSLPFSASTFDLVTAVETHYYWPNLSADVREVLRVLKPGGRFALIAETYRGRTDDWLYRPAMKLLGATYLDLGEHRALLAEAGFSDVGVFEERGRGWICALGTKA